MEHEAIEELLAGYVLRALSGEDAREADRLLSEHVPACAMCRDTLAGLQEVAGEIALDPSPIAPPDVLLPRMHRELGSPAPRRRQIGVFAAAASVVAVLGLGGLAVTQGIAASDARKRIALVQDALDLSRQPDASRVAVGPVTEIGRAGVRELYIYGTHVPDPAPGTVYRLWLGTGTSYTWVGDFLPEAGIVILQFPFDPSRYDRVVVTEEPEGSVPAQPVGELWSSAA